MLKLALAFAYFLNVQSQTVPFAFFKKNDPCTGTPARGTVCSGGALYAGQFDSGKYMVTPSGCTNSATPTCAGGTDSLTKTWRGSTGSDVDIPGVENITNATTASSSSFRGNVNTAAIVAHASISSNSAADFCNDMTYGGYSDWYLPSKSELAYLYCHASVTSHNSSYPNENPNCTSYGGKTSELTGFINNFYWSSTESNFNDAIWEMQFSNGVQDTYFKNTSFYVRCVRRY